MTDRELMQQPQRTHWEGCEAVHPECRKPRREWVSLTDDQVSAIADQHPVEGFDPSIMAFARAIEAKLREKNNG
jgi:hypothetical protein